MIDAQDVGAEFAEPGRDLAQNSRPIRDGEAERDDAVGALQFAHHDGREDARIDIAAAQDQADLAAAESLRLGQHGGKPGGAGPFRHGLLQREKGIDRALDQRLVDQNDVADEFAHDRQRQLADIAHRNAFGQRRAAARPVALVDRIPHRRIERAFDADDLDRGLLRPRGDGAAGDQPAAADRNDQHVEVGHLLQHFQRDRPLAGDDVRIVVGVNPDEIRARPRLPRRAAALP